MKHHKIRILMFVLLAFVGIIAGMQFAHRRFIRETREATQRADEASAQMLCRLEVRSGAMRDLEQLRSGRPACREDDRDYPCYGVLVQRLRNKFKAPVTCPIASTNRTHQLTSEDVTLYDQELERYERTDTLARIGTRAFQIMHAPADGWSACTTESMGQRVEEVVTLGNQVDLATLVIVIHGSSDSDDDWRTEPYRTSEKALRARAAVWHGDCADSMFKQLVEFPEQGMGPVAPISLAGAIITHRDQANFDSLPMRLRDDSLRLVARAAYARQGTYLIRRFRQLRSTGELAYPETRRWSRDLHELHEDSGLPWSAFGTSEQEIERLTGELPRSLTSGQGTFL